MLRGARKTKLVVEREETISHRHILIIPFYTPYKLKDTLLYIYIYSHSFRSLFFFFFFFFSAVVDDEVLAHYSLYFRFWSINAESASNVSEPGSWELLVVPRVDRPPDFVSSLLFPEDLPLLPPDFFVGDAFDLLFVPRNDALLLLFVLFLVSLLLPIST